MRARDTSVEADAVQIDAYRRMTPGARLRVALELTELSRRLVAAGVRRRHPEYTDEQVRLATIRLWLGEELYRQAYAGCAELAP
ncbi:MAG: hypothetical protein HY906_23275 [Deltaproteobacteria bacterium]|nr:hypothetical protein [Deltaproteobacteria bacterium]